MSCPFCEGVEPVLEGDLALALRDRFPVAEGHTLVIPRRHVESYFDLDPEERAAVWELVQRARDQLREAMDPDGFNVGINVGPAAGQSVMHAHVHLIPRRRGDVARPRGGVRGVIPGKQDY